MGQKRHWFGFLAFVFVVLCSGCASQSSLGRPVDGNENGIQGGGDISYGAIKKNLKVGASTQADVIKKFGSPNNMTYQGKGRGELWIYDRIKTESMTQTEAASAGVAVGGVAGTGSGAIGASIGGSSNRSATRASSSVRMLTVILEFDEGGTLIDISARQGGY